MNAYEIVTLLEKAATLVSSNLIQTRKNAEFYKVYKELEDEGYIPMLGVDEDAGWLVARAVNAPHTPECKPELCLCRGAYRVPIPLTGPDRIVQLSQKLTSTTHTGKI